MSIQSYNEELKKRVEWVKEAFNVPLNDPGRMVNLEYHTRQLLEYLEGLNWFEEEEKKHPLMMTQKNGNLIPIEDFMKQDWKFCPICGRPLYVVRGKLTCRQQPLRLSQM